MINYRQGNLADLDIFLKARIDFLHTVNDIKNKEDELFLYTSNKEYLIKCLQEKTIVLWLAFYENEIAGTASTSFYYLPPSAHRPTGKVAYIGNMFTYPQYRKQGIAGTLFAYAMEEAKKANAHKILLDATDMGRPLYEKFGFVPSDIAMVYHLD